jgi:hypothetical protein
MHRVLGASSGLSAEDLVSRLEAATLRASEGVPRDDLALLALRVSEARGEVRARAA